ncbi:diacylglycerol kinase family enzyme [Cryobacterium mesophilum]|uniref:Diacylglycerol kinase family lipid kinase n=1 Tax=Terrimesophilobacter mesophilus TaxID=433647 RepID=A0A4R8VAZ2_9MICO|nr:diacylglycerol kinase family protein [Terrimesophilobacter mesophilus]MBB5632988.1 diacylglycerol kinase family enzyme [Terrimesophilobacter mesophilus]TFB79755.1 diacylglycerol kinase family lipid kinase [Terrimesophilobacter mesophilus]
MVGDGSRSGRASTRSRHAAVVYNPTKVDLRKLRKAVEKAEADAGWGRTRWLATSETDAGQAVTREAVEKGAAVVIAAGGDGTVRAVAQGLRDTSVPITLLPAGTGNLLARNLDIDLANLDACIAAAFTGDERTVDVGIAEITREDHSAEEHVFLVMAGLGLDAKMIAKTNPKLKKAVGWLAYVDAGMRAIPELSPVRLRYRLDDGGERPLTAHTLIVGNCGSLPGGILLLPDAKPDDGILDIAALKPRGRFGWVRVWNKIAWENGVLRKSAAGRRIIDLTADVRDVAYFRGRRLRATLESPQEFQLDGDEFGTVTAIDCTTDAGGLRVKIPA